MDTENINQLPEEIIPQNLTKKESKKRGLIIGFIFGLLIALLYEYGWVLPNFIEAAVGDILRITVWPFVVFHEAFHSWFEYWFVYDFQYTIVYPLLVITWMIIGGIIGHFSNTKKGFLISMSIFVLIMVLSSLYLYSILLPVLRSKGL